jgi:hypothetical protein
MNASVINDAGVNYEKTDTGYMDYLMLDRDGHALVVLEAKREDRDCKIFCVNDKIPT